KPESRTGLGLVKTAAAAGHLLALLGRKPWPVIVDHDAHDAAIIPWIGFFREHFDRDPRLRPFAGIGDKVADHLLEVLLLAAEARTFRRVNVDDAAAIMGECSHRAREREYDRPHVGSGPDRRDARRKPRPLEMA